MTRTALAYLALALSLTTTATALAQISHDLPVVPPTTIARIKPAVCEESNVKHYTAQRTSGAIKIDGLLNDSDWQKAKKTPRFVDMATGGPAMFDTKAAVLWDDQKLYIAFWVEEPFVEAKLEEKNSLIFNENDAEVFIDGGDTYYEFETNARGTTYQMFYIWRDAYKKGSRFDVPEFDVVKNNALTFGGDYDRQAPTFWKGTNPRGLRWAFFGWQFPEMQSATHIDGTINNNSDVDKGWTVELAFPWNGAKWLAGNRSLPPKEGDVWKIFLGRFEHFRIAGNEVQPAPGWAVNSHGVYDTHLPQCWTAIHFSNSVVP